MHLYRLSSKEWAEDLRGQSGMLTDNYWNKAGDACIYLFDSVAACLLENDIYRATKSINPVMRMVEYEVPMTSLQNFDLTKLNTAHEESTELVYREFGSCQLSARKTLVLAFPSRFLRRQLNYLINPLHELMLEVKIINTFEPLW